MTTLGVLGAILFVALVVGAVMVRKSEVAKLKGTKEGDSKLQRYIVGPEVEQQLDVIQARARKRRSDFGTKRGPRPPKDDGTGMSEDEKGWIG